MNFFKKLGNGFLLLLLVSVTLIAVEFYNIYITIFCILLMNFLIWNNKNNMKDIYLYYLNVSIILYCLLFYIFPYAFMISWYYYEIDLNLALLLIVFIFIILFIYILPYMGITQFFFNKENKKVKFYLIFLLNILTALFVIGAIYCNTELKSIIKVERPEKYYSIYVDGVVDPVIDKNSFIREESTFIKTNLGIFYHSTLYRKPLLTINEVESLPDNNIFKDPNFIELKILNKEKNKNNILINYNPSNKYSAQDISDSLFELQFFLQRKEDKKDQENKTNYFIEVK